MSADVPRSVQIARAWIGTPYRHQTSVRGHGTDCLGLIRGIWRELYGAEPETVPPYTRDWSEPQGDEVLLRAATRHLIPAGRDLHQPGGVLLFRMRAGSVAKHLGIAAANADGPTVIHAYTGHGVVESALTGPWRRRVVARFAFPGEDL